MEKKIPNAKRKVAKLATGGRKGLCIVILKHRVTLEELCENEDEVVHELEHDARRRPLQSNSIRRSQWATKLRYPSNIAARRAELLLICQMQRKK